MDMANVISVKEASKLNLIEVLVFDFPKKRYNTQYGRITHYEWLLKEKERMSKKGRNCRIVSGEFLFGDEDVFKYALYANRVPLMEVI